MHLWKGLGITAIALLSLSFILYGRSRHSTAHLAHLESAPPKLAEQSAPDLKQAAIAFEQRWVISASEAQQLIGQGATLLDARGKKLGQQRLPGAQSVTWDQFSPKAAHRRGRLLEDDTQLTEKLQALGISDHRPVVVFGDPLNGWGEEGRIVWMLRTLGHGKAVMVDGGITAFQQAAGLDQRSPSSDHAASRPSKDLAGDFVVQRQSHWDIQRDALQSRLGSPQLVVIDTRELREFAGQTPYGEQRGGHIPGAVHLYFKDVMAPDGKLLPDAAIVQTLSQLGITPASQVVVYCTGGIRSGWLTAVLTSLGFSAQNYAGSMWEWSAAPATSFPLETH